MTMQEVSAEPGPEPAPAPKKGRTARTLWHTAIYMAGLVTSRGAMLLLLPIITRMLEVQYTLYDLCMTTVLFLNPFLNLGLQSSVVRYYFHYDTRVEQRRFYNTSLIFLLAMFVPTVGLLFYFSDDLAGLLFKEAEHGDLFRLAVVVSALTAFSLQPLALLRAQEKTYIYSALQLVRGVAGPGTIFLLLVFFRQGIRGILWGEIVGLTILTVAGLAVTSRWLYPAFDFRKLKPLLAFGLPLLPMGVGGALLTVSDRYILRSHLSLEEMAPYSLGFKVGMALSLLIQALQLSWIPAAFNLAKTGSRGSIAKSVLVLQLLLFGMAMATAALAPELARFFAPGKVFEGAHYIIPWIAFSFAMHGVVTLIGAAFGIAKRTVWSSLVFCTAGGVKVALSLLVIPRYGIQGAAITTFASFALELGLAYFIAQRVYPVPFDTKRFWGTYAFSTAGFVGVLLSFALPPAHSLAARLLLLGAFCAASYFFILTASDRRAVWETAATRWASIQTRLARQPQA